ncbi:hypothetical protein PPHE_a0861 [Pseudoalteromonas phenolica O-BC30]|nr:hypothetical protein [Pseudoalteromonas phenolica O-BC30]
MFVKSLVLFLGRFWRVKSLAASCSFYYCAKNEHDCEEVGLFCH